MHVFDLDLKRIAADGCPPLPANLESDYLRHNGAKLWFATAGSGPAVLLLHGGLGHSGNWAYQLPPLLAAGYRVILLDTRGHGRSSRDQQEFGYDLLRDDALAVLQHLNVVRTAVIGWSDGAVVALRMAQKRADLVAGVFFFACNVDPSGVKEFDASRVTVQRCFSRHASDYKQLSSTPDEFDTFVAAVNQMQATEPNISRNALAAIDLPFTIAIGTDDEFIEPSHLRYVANGITGSEYVSFAGLTHFAPWQAPELFSQQLLAFLADLNK